MWWTEPETGQCHVDLPKGTSWQKPIKVAPKKQKWVLLKQYPHSCLESRYDFR